MANISGSSGSGAASGSALPIAGAAPPANAAQSSAARGAEDGGDHFTQLINDMIEETGTDQGAASSLQELAGLALGADSGKCTRDESDTDGKGASDGDIGALAMAALLPGLSCLAPPSSPAKGAAADTGTDAIDPALLAKNTDLNAAKTALAALAGDAGDGAAKGGSTDATGNAASTNQTATPSTQMHALMAAHAARDVDATPDNALNAPVGTPAWKEELGAQLTWMAAKGIEAASLRLSPEHLGPLDIRISVHEGQASVLFSAANPDTRSALEQSLPRLREMFASQGLVLSDAGVSRDAPRNAFKPSTQPAAVRGVSDASAETSVKAITLARLGLVDTYV